MMKKAISQKITFIMFLANVLILFHHANLSGYVENTGAAGYVMNFFSSIAQPGMTWFFLISAYLFFRKIELSDFKRKFVSRIHSVLIPYLIWNTLAVALKIVFGRRFDSLWDFIRSCYLFYGNTGVANGPLWYLFRLLEFIAIAPIIHLIVKNKKMWVTFGACGFLTAVNIVFQVSYFSFSYFLPVYIIGAYAGSNCSEKIEKFVLKKKAQHRSLRLLGIVIALMLLGIVCQNSSIYALCLVSRYAVVFLIPLLFLFLPNISVKSKFILGGGGMWLYCCHYLTFTMVRTLILKIDLPVLITWLLMIAVSLIIMYLIWRFLYKYCKTILSVLVGGRV